MYEIVKVLNNNTLLALKDNQEVIFLGKGIGFKKKVGELFQPDEQCQEYALVEKGNGKRNIEKDIVSINPIFIEIASEIIRLAKIQFDHVDEKILLPLVDHIEFAISRLENKMEIKIPTIYEENIDSFIYKNGDVIFKYFTDANEKINIMFKSVYGTLPPVKIANGIWEFLKKLTDGFQATDPADAVLSSNADWWALIQLIIMVWAIFKVFFSNLKRGGILLVQICVGSMHMLALARGYTDGFGSWCKQVAALCFTAFVQNLLYLLAIIMMQDAASSSLYFSLGLLLVAAEVPRIAQMFGLDTSARVSLGNAAHNVSSVVSLVKQFA